MSHCKTTNPPLGLRREGATAYLGVGTTKFDEMVGDVRMPQTRCVDNCKIWDRNELEGTFEALPRKKPENTFRGMMWDEW